MKLSGALFLLVLFMSNIWAKVCTFSDDANTEATSIVFVAQNSPTGTYDCIMGATFTVNEGLANPEALVLSFRYTTDINLNQGEQVTVTLKGRKTDGGALVTFATRVNDNQPTLENDALFNEETGIIYFKAFDPEIEFDTNTLDNPVGLNAILQIAEHWAGADLDGDGFTYPDGECCDSQRYCSYPSLVNRAAFEVSTNGIYDAGYGSKCSQTYTFADDFEQIDCASSCSYGSACSPKSLTQALELCKFDTDSGVEDTDWRVISATLTQADGSGSPCTWQTSIMTSFSTYFDLNYDNDEFLVISSGQAHTNNGGTSKSCSGSASYLPSEFGAIETRGDCPSGSRYTRDSASLNVELKVPINAYSFNYKLAFMSEEYGYWYCTQYNDMFITLLYSDHPDMAQHIPDDHNIAKATVEINGQDEDVGLSINNDKFFVYCQSTCYTSPGKCGGTGCSGDLSPLSDTSYSDNAGSTILTNYATVIPGAVITLRFLIFDNSDAYYQSTALLNYFQWSVIEVSGSAIDAYDACPNDDTKVEPGICNCGIPDTNSDSDIYPDCIDACPDDSSKYESKGLCGCGNDDGTFMGFAESCALDTASCCSTDDYLGGTMSWDYVSNINSDAVEFHVRHYTTASHWCYDIVTEYFVPCGQTGGVVYPAGIPAGNQFARALPLNYGVYYPVTVDESNSYEEILDASASGFSVLTGFGYDNDYLYLTNPSSQKTVDFVPQLSTGAGYYYVSVYSISQSLTILPITYTISHNGETTNRVFRSLGNGWYTLGSFYFTDSGSEKVTATTSTGSGVAIIDAVRFTSYSPDADNWVLNTNGQKTNSDISFYSPEGEVFEIQVESDCSTQLYARRNGIATTTSFTLSDTTGGTSGVKITSSGGIYSFLIVTSSANCEFHMIKRIWHVMTVDYYFEQEDLISLSADILYHYPARSLGSSPEPFIASYEGLARAQTSNTKSFRLEATVAVPNSAGRGSGSISTVPMIVVPQDYADGIPVAIGSIDFSSIGGSVFNLAVSPSHSKFSSDFFSDSYKISTCNPGGVVVSGSVDSFSISQFSSLSLGYHILCLELTDTVTGSTAPLDILIQILSPEGGGGSSPVNTNPTITADPSNGPLLQGCPIDLLFYATDVDSGDSLSEITKLITGSSSENSFNVVSNSATNKIIELSLTADDLSGSPGTTLGEDLTSIELTAFDANGGVSHFEVTMKSLGEEARGCPTSQSGDICNNQGTCNCDGTCSCIGRWTGSSCSTFTNSAPTIADINLEIEEDSGLNTFNLDLFDSDGDDMIVSLLNSNFYGTVTVSSTGQVKLTPTANRFNTPPDNKWGVDPGDEYVSVSVSDSGDSDIPPGSGKSSNKIFSIIVINVNDIPQPATITVTASEDCSEFSQQVTATDADGDDLTFSSSATTSLGTFQMNSDGTFTFECASNQFGLYSLPYTVYDGTANQNGTINVVISSVNDAPTANHLAFTIEEDASPSSHQLIASDVENDSLTYVKSVPSSFQGTISNFNSNTGSFDYAPAANFEGYEEFYFYVEESSGSGLKSSLRTVSITVTAVNDDPVLSEYTISVIEDTLKSGLFLTATDVDGDILEYAIASSTQNTITLASDFTTSGSYSYTPPENVFGVGADSFEFTVSDGTVTKTGTITVDIAPVNDAPTISLATETVTVDEDYPGTYTYNNIIVVDSFGQGESDSVQSVNIQVNSGSNLFASGPSISNGLDLTFELKADLNGDAVIEVSVTDDGGGSDATSNTLQFTISVTPVNDKPTFTVAPNFALNEGSSITDSRSVGIGVIVGPTVDETSSQTFTFSISDASGCSSSLFSIFPNIPQGTSNIVSKPAADENGICTLKIQVTDSGDGDNTSDEQTLVITINPTNDPPSFTLTDTGNNPTVYTVDEDSTGNLHQWAVENSISAGPADETESVRFEIASTITAGLFDSISISATGVLSYTLSPNANGQRTFQVYLTEYGISNPLKTSNYQITIVVNPVNDDPTWETLISSLDFTEDDPAQILEVADTLSTGDLPSDGQTLSDSVDFSDCNSNLFSATPATYISQGSVYLTFTPAANRYTTLSCDVVVSLSDGQASIHLTLPFTLTPINDKPTFVAGNTILISREGGDAIVVTNQDWATSISAGIYEDTQSVSSFTLTPIGSIPNIFTSSPSMNSDGQISFTVESGTSFGLSKYNVHCTDSEGLVSNSVQLTISIESGNFSVTYDITSTVNIDEDSGTYTETSFIDNLSIGDDAFENSVEINVEFVSGDSDLLTSLPSFTVTPNSFDVDGNGGDAQLELTPAANKYGSAIYQVTVFVGDTNSLQTKQFTLNVVNVNDPPSYTIADPTVDVVEDYNNGQQALLPGFATSISAGPYETESVSFTVSCDAAANSLFSTGNKPAISPSGTLSFAVEADAFGSSVCSVTLNDGNDNAANVEEITITLASVNDIPSFSLTNSLTIDEDAGPISESNFATSIVAGPSNENEGIDGFTVTHDCGASDFFASAPTISNTGTLSFQVKDNVFGSCTLTVVLKDNENAESASQEIALTVNPINDAPSFDIALTTIPINEDHGSDRLEDFISNINVGPLESDGYTLTISSDNDDLFDSYSIVDGLDFKFLPKDDLSGSATFTIVMTDDGSPAESHTKTFTLTIAAVNENPSFTSGVPVISVNEDGSTTVSSWAENINPGDSEESYQTLTWDYTFSNGNLLDSFSIDPSTGDLSLTTVADANGVEIIEIRLFDQELYSSIFQLTVNVLAVNDAPSLSIVTTTVSIIEDSGSNPIPVFDSLSKGPSNEDGQTLSFVITSDLSTTNLFNSVPFFSINNGEATLTLVTKANQFGSYNLKGKLTDDGGVARNGVDKTSEFTIAITVEPKNDKPSFSVVNTVFTIDEDSGNQAIAGIFTDISKGASNENGQTLTWHVSVNDGSGLVGNPSVNGNSELVVEPVANFNGNIEFTVFVTDNGGTDHFGEDTSDSVQFTLSISPVDDYPVAVADFFTVSEDNSMIVDLVSNDQDIDGDELFVSEPSISGTSANGGTVSIQAGEKLVEYTPAANFYGQDTFTYAVTDKICPKCISQNTVTVTFNVNSVNDEPTVGDLTLTIDEDSIYSDTYDNTFTDTTDIEDTSFDLYIIVSSTTKGTLALNPAAKTVEYVPNYNFCGSDSFTYKFKDSDGADSNVGTVNIVVNCVNDAPTANDVTETMYESTDAQLTTAILVVDVADVDGDSLRYQCNSGPSFGNIGIAKDTWYSISQTITYSPPKYRNGNVSFNCKVRDPSGEEASFTMNVVINGPDNHAPVILVDPIEIEAIEDKNGIGNLLAIDYDIQIGDSITYSIVEVTTPSICSITIPSASGDFSYILAADKNGLCSFKWKVTDTLGPADSSIGTVNINIAPANDIPIAHNVEVTIQEDVLTSNLQLDGSDVDISNEGDTLTYKSTLFDLNGGTISITDALAGKFSFDPADDFYGTLIRKYRVFDSIGEKSNEANITIIVENVNDAPTCNSISGLTGTEDGSINVTFYGSDIDNTDNELTYSIKFDPQKGSIGPIIGANTVYTPNANYFGNDEFHYKVSDGEYEVSCIVSLFVSSVNDLPTVEDDSWSVSADGQINDDLSYTDVDSTTITIEIMVDPSKGTLTQASSGSAEVTYVPDASGDPNYSASDSFEYRACDEFGCSEKGVVSISIEKSDNNPPVAQDLTIPMQEDQTLTSALQGSDPDGHDIIYEIRSQPTSGKITAFDETTGAYTYVPQSNFFGTVTMTYRTFDGAFTSSTATVTFNIQSVNDVPVCQALSFQIEEDTVYTGDVFCSDVDGDSLTLTFLGDGVGSKGVAAFTSGGYSSSTTTTFTYTPNADVSGSDTISYQANDGTANSIKKQISVTITPVPDAPSAPNLNYKTNEDTVLTRTIVATDPDSTDLYYFLQDEIDPEGTVVLDSQTGTFVYTPPANFFGFDEFAYRVSDGDLASNMAFVNIEVIAQPDVPFGQSETVTVVEDTTTELTLFGDDVDLLPGENPVDFLTWNLRTQKSTNGASLSLVDNIVTYVPIANSNDEDSFQYKVTDTVSSSIWYTITVEIDPVNDAPLATSLSRSVATENSVTITVPGSDIDSDLLHLSFSNSPSLGSVVVVPSPQLTFIYEAGEDAGTETLNAIVTDDGGLEATANVIIYVTAPGVEAPEVDDLYLTGNEDTDLAISLSAFGSGSASMSKFEISHLDSQIATIKIDNLNGSLTNDGSYHIVLEFAQNWNGQFSFQYTGVNLEGGVSVPGLITVIVYPVDDPPVADSVTFVMNEDETEVFTLTGSDIDSSYFVFAFHSYPSSIHDYSLDQDGTLTFTPQLNFNGEVSFTFKTDDLSSKSPAATVIIEVVSVNDVPESAADEFDMQEDTELSGPKVKVTCEDVDEDDVSAFVLVSSPASGTLDLDSETGLFTYTPIANYFGTVTFKYLCDDGLSQSTESVITIVVEPENDAPVAIDATITTPEDVPFYGLLYGSDIEDGINVKFLQKTLASNGTVQLSETGVLTYIPNENFVGLNTFQFVVYDSENKFSQRATVNISVTEVRDIPIAKPDLFEMDEDTILTANLEGTDGDGDDLLFILKQLPLRGKITLDDDQTGQFTYTPQANYNGNDILYFAVQDQDAQSSTSACVIKIHPVNDLPVAYDLTQNVTIGGSAVGTFLATDIDDDDVLNAQIVSDPTHGTVRITYPSFTLDYSGNVEDGVTTDEFTFVIVDSAGGVSNEATVSINLLTANVIGSEVNNTGANNTGAIIGAIVGGVIALLAAVAAILGYVKWQTLQAKKAAEQAMVNDLDAYDNPLYDSLGPEANGPGAPQQALSPDGEVFMETFTNPMLN